MCKRFTEAEFLLAGNGSQWPLMAAELLEDSPTFRASIEACAGALERYGIDLVAEFGRAEGWSTPALTMAGLSAVQVRFCFAHSSRVCRWRACMTLPLSCFQPARELLSLGQWLVVATCRPI